MHPIIQAEIDEFRKEFVNKWSFIHQEVCANGESCVCIIGDLESFLSAALHRAVEKAGKEIVWDEDEGDIDPYNQLAKGYNSHRSFALSKLDTIINFKE